MKTSELAQLFKAHPDWDYEIAGTLYESDKPRIEVSLQLFRAIGCAQSRRPTLYVLVDERDGYVLIQDKEVKGSTRLDFDGFDYLATWFTLLGEIAPPIQSVKIEPSDTRFG